ncbi:MAG: glycosyltransferase family 4 protein [Phycisphaerae bacterium]|nr:glycosyltransferase family 4 protein [Phycisphaerae bacterium]
MSARKPCVVVLGGSSSLHARIPAQMVREAGYRVVLADMEPTIAPGTEEFYDHVYPLQHSLEKPFLAVRSAVTKPEGKRPIKEMEILEPTRNKSLYWRLFSAWLRGRRLARIVRAEHPGLVHIQGTWVCGMTMYYYLKRMGFDARKRPGTMAHLFSYQPRFAGIRAREIRALQACDQLHSSSLVVKKIYQQHYEVPPEKLHLLVRGINLKTFAPRDEAILAQAREEWGVPADKFVLIHNRHLHPMYRVDLAVDTFIELAQRGHDVFLILVRGSMCEADYEAQFVAQMKEAGLGDRFALMPPILSAEQMAVALQLSDISINTVPFDAFPVSILESMYCHAVPVVRDLESYYIFVKEGETGFLCGGTGANEYVEKTERLILAPQLKERIANAGAKVVENEANVATYRRNLLGLIKRCWREW